MDPRRVLLFRDTVRAGSISAAARNLGWTQPALSQQLQHLEREAGTVLLLRGARGVTPTEAGERLLRRADAIAGELHMAGDELAEIVELHGGRCRLVAFPSAAAVHAPPLLARLARERPGALISLVEAEPPEAWELVRTGQADVGLVFGHDGPPPDHGDLVWRPFLVEPVDLVIPASMGLSPDPAMWRTLRDAVWIGGCVRCRTHLIRTCEQQGFTPQIRYETDDYVTVQNLVAAGLGVALMPRSVLTAFRHPEIRVCEDAAFGTRHIGIIHRSGADDVPAIRAVIEALESERHKH